VLHYSEEKIGDTSNFKNLKLLYFSGRQRGGILKEFKTKLPSQPELCI
jgi:hypothetical protein